MTRRRWSSASGAVLALVVVLAAPLLMSACGTAVRATTDDATITARVKTAFINDPAVPAPRIDIATSQGVVSLSGRVATREQETRAVALARSVAGVKDVKSTLQIQP